MFIELKTEEDYTNATSKDFVLIDIWAEWCGPCRQLKQILEQNDLGIPVYTLNADTLPDIPTNLGIRSIPCLLLFKEGKEVDLLLLCERIPRLQLVKEIANRYPKITIISESVGFNVYYMSR